MGSCQIWVALTELENKKTGIEEASETEKLKQALVEDENSIKKYFEMYAKADFDDEDTRNRVLEYFVDKIYVYNDRRHCYSQVHYVENGLRPRFLSKINGFKPFFSASNES